MYGRCETTVEQINNTTEKIQYLHHDQAGSTRLMTSSMGMVEGSYTYGPYGETTGHTGTPLGYDAIHVIGHGSDLSPREGLRPRDRAVPHPLGSIPGLRFLRTRRHGRTFRICQLLMFELRRRPTSQDLRQSSSC